MCLSNDLAKLGQRFELPAVEFVPFAVFSGDGKVQDEQAPCNSGMVRMLTILVFTTKVDASTFFVELSKELLAKG